MGDTTVAPSGAAGGAGQSANANTTGAAGAAGVDMNKGEIGVTEEELKKSLDRLEGVVNSSPEGRKHALLSKAMGGSITQLENVELMRLLGGESFDKSLTGGVMNALDPAANDTLSKSIDVSPYLDELHNHLSGAMLQVAEHIEKSDQRHQEHVVVLAKGLLDVGKVVVGIASFQKALAERLGIVDRQPARGPRALGAGGNTVPGGAQPIEKGFGGAPAQGEQLSKSQVSDILFAMLQDSMADGRDGMSKGGARIDIESSQYEQFNQFSSPAFEAEVIAFAKSKRQAKVNGHAR